jgi:hypothetical protein
MDHPPDQSDIPGTRCATCGAVVTGRFCSRCGTPTRDARCAACQAPLTPGGRFCHRCGVPVGSAAGSGAGGRGRERLAWSLAGVAGLAALLALLWRGNAAPTVPDMGNAGNLGAPGAAPALSGQAPDISNMSPRERFDRLFERVVRAAEAGDSVTVIQFAPMALGAYSMLGDADADARYHAATINLVIGDLPAALALADTILANAPGHLFGYLIRGEAADRQNDAAALTRSYRSFLDHYEAELKAGRIEYAEHKPVLDDFRTRAAASLPQ